MNRGKVFWIGRSFLRGCSYFSVEKSRMRKVSGKFVSNHFFPEYTFKYICEEIEEMLAAGEQKQFQLVEISSREKGFWIGKEDNCPQSVKSCICKEKHGFRCTRGEKCYSSYYVVDSCCMDMFPNERFRGGVEWFCVRDFERITGLNLDLGEQKKFRLEDEKCFGLEEMRSVHIK